MTGTITPYRSDLPLGRDSFAHLLRAEWTKFRTVRGWVIGMAAAAVATVLISMLGATGSSTGGGGGDFDPPTGPGGELVHDKFSFVSRPLVGDGSITVRVASLDGEVLSVGPAQNPARGPHEWAKAGLIVKAGTEAGSTYAAVMVTPGHGVRMQHDFTHDQAGRPGAVTDASPRWLRLTRSGDTVTGHESVDGKRWTEVGAVRLSGLTSTVQAGLFVASPQYEETSQSLGALTSNGGPTQATARFDRVGLKGGWSKDAWRNEEIGGETGGLAEPVEAFDESGGTFTVTGSGDIGPAPAGPGGSTVEQNVVGAFAGLVVVIVVGTMFMTAEYRRGLIRTTLAVSPRRGRVLAAKAMVLGGVTFGVGLAASVVAYWLVGSIRRGNGDVPIPVSSLTELRVVVGTAALLAVASVLALAVGTVLRRSAGAVTAVIVALVLPYILAVSSVLPVVPAQWLLRVTPAAAFAIQQSTPEYSQVATAYLPSSGYFPLAPLAGFAVLCAWTGLALGLAAVLLRRRDA
jgi:ABC-type transport system involved in multi-copper enzyme maturation permease subunit